jgi:hypothetical protein
MLVRQMYLYLGDTGLNIPLCTLFNDHQKDIENECSALIWFPLEENPKEGYFEEIIWISIDESKSLII